MADESNRPDEGAEDRSAFVGSQDAALKTLAADEGTPLDLAAVLRQQPELLDLYPLPDTERVSTVRELVQLSSADAIALVEGGQVSVDQAALVGHEVRRSFAHNRLPGVSEDFQLRAMKRLADGKPVSAEFAAYFKNPVEEVANEVLNEEKAERRRLDCEGIWNGTYWKFWTVLSWIAFRDINRLCEDKEGFSQLTRYAQASQKELHPGRLLLTALKNGELKAIRDGEKVPVLYWADKDEVDRDVVFLRFDVRQCWSALDLRGDLDHAHDVCVNRNGKDEWDGFGSPAWSHGQALIWRVSRNQEAVDKASADSRRPSLGEHYGKNVAAAVIELYKLNIGELKDAARELRRLCLDGDLTAYDVDGNPIDPMAWLPLEIDFDTENRPWVMRHGVPTNDVEFRRRDVLRVWPERPVAGDRLADAYADVVKRHEDEGRRRVLHDWHAKRIECITQRLTAPASLKDRAHICVWDIIEDRTAATPEMRAAWLDALVAAVNAGMFVEGGRQQSRLFSFSDAGHVIRWDKKSLAKFQQAIDEAAHKFNLDLDKYRLQRLESLARGAWMPRRFIAQWLTEYCKVSRLPWWLEGTTPDDLHHGDDSAVAPAGDSTDKPMSDTALASLFARLHSASQSAPAPARRKVSQVPEPPEIVTGRFVSRVPAPPPQTDYSCTPPEPKQKEPEPDSDLIGDICQCESLINAGRRKTKFRGPLWDVEKKRWPFYRKRVDEGVVRCGLSGNEAYRRNLDKLDHEWAVVCEYRDAIAASSDELEDKAPSANCAEPATTASEPPRAADVAATPTALTDRPEDDPAFDPWFGSPIVSQGWDIQRIYQHLTRSCGFEPDAAIDELNLRASWVLWCVRFGATLLQSPPRDNIVRDRATFRLGKGNTVEIVMHPALSGKPMDFKALPEDVLKMWPVTQPDSSTAARPAIGDDLPAQGENGVMRTGAPGRPSKSMHLIVDEHTRRIQANEAVHGAKEEAGVLLTWLKENHKDAPRPTAKTIENNIRNAHRQAGLIAAKTPRN